METGKKHSTQEWKISKKPLHQELVGKKFGDYVISSSVKWRKQCGKQVRTYVEVTCSHGTDRVLLDNLKRGAQLGCIECYAIRNNLPIFTNENQRDLYYRVRSIILRCYNASTNGYTAYGGRGIRVHDDWVTRPELMVDYLLSLPGADLSKTVDRIDVNGHYEPGNLRWATQEEQAINRRNSVYVVYLDKRMHIQDFARKHSKLSLSQTRERIKQGWTPEQIAAWSPLPRGNRVRFSKRRTTA